MVRHHHHHQQQLSLVGAGYWPMIVLAAGAAVVSRLVEWMLTELVGVKTFRRTSPGRRTVLDVVEKGITPETGAWIEVRRIKAGTEAKAGVKTLKIVTTGKRIVI